MGAQQSLIYQPPSPPSYSSALEDLSWIEIDSTAKIPIVFIPFQQGNDIASYTILYAGSNSQDIGTCLAWLKTIQLMLKVNIIAFDYPGFGLNEGEASEKGVYQSISEVFTYLTTKKKINPENIILMGKDLGTAAVIHVIHELLSGSKKKPTGGIPSGLVLISGFSSIAGIVGSKMKFAKDMYDNTKKMEKIEIPVFMVHGLKDEMIDIKVAKKLAAKTPNLWKLLEVDAVHHEVDFSDDFMDELIKYFDVVRQNDPNYKPAVVKEIVVPTMYQRTMTVDKWLESIQLSEYAQRFLLNGYFSMDVVKSIDMIDLEAMEIENKEHIEQIMTAVRQLTSGRGVGGMNDAIKNGDPHSITSMVGEGHADDDDDLGHDDTVLPTFGPSEPNADAFRALLLDSDCPVPIPGDARTSKRWENSLSFASSINIPYWEDKNDELLAKGFFGEVYKSLLNDQPVIKRILNYKRNQFRKFCQEAIILSQLEHPNIVKNIGAFMDKKKPPGMITEYVEGTNLTNFIQKHEIDTKLKIKLAQEIASALQYLHNQNPPIVHRDLTTNNILVTSSSPETVKLSDFGLGRPPAFTFMAPEIYNRAPYTTSADIYSFALVLYYIIVRKMPFEGMEGAEAAARAAKMHIRPTIPDDTPTIWKTLISSCWHRNPVQRPSAEQILERLLLISHDEGVDVPEFERVDSSSASLLDISFLQVKEKEQEQEEKVMIKCGGLNYPSSMLVYQLFSIVNDPKYSDLTIHVAGESFFAHRAIIAARNDNMAALIEQAGETRQITIDHKDISARSFKVLLEYIYTSILTVSNENVYDIMEAANQLNIQQAVDVCREFIDDHGIPVSVKALKAGEQENANTQRIRNMKESLIGVECGIQNIENSLDILCRKLERITTRMTAS